MRIFFSATSVRVYYILTFCVRIFMYAQTLKIGLLTRSRSRVGYYSLNHNRTSVRNDRLRYRFLFLMLF